MFRYYCLRKTYNIIRRLGMDNKQKYLNEHSKAKKVFRVLGLISLSAGIIITIIFFINFFSDFYNPGSFMVPKLSFLGFIGIPLIAFGLICLSIGFMKEINQFTASQTVPVAKDVVNYMIDGTRDEFEKTISYGVKKYKEYKENELIERNNKCAKCGTINPEDAKFCSNCGSEITLKCPKCGLVNDDHSNYCNECGTKLK